MVAQTVFRPLPQAAAAEKHEIDHRGDWIAWKREQNPPVQASNNERLSRLDREPMAPHFAADGCNRLANMVFVAPRRPSISNDDVGFCCGSSRPATPTTFAVKI